MLRSRYGSDLVSVESFRQNNFTAELASEYLTGQEESSYWLGLQAYNELQTNTLSADDGHQVLLSYVKLCLWGPFLNIFLSQEALLNERQQRASRLCFAFIDIYERKTQPLRSNSPNARYNYSYRASRFGLTLAGVAS